MNDTADKLALSSTVEQGQEPDGVRAPDGPPVTSGRQRLENALWKLNQIRLDRLTVKDMLQIVSLKEMSGQNLTDNVADLYAQDGERILRRAHAEHHERIPEVEGSANR